MDYANLIVASILAALVEGLVLRRMRISRSRGQVVLVVAPMMLGLVSIGFAEAITGELWAMYVPGVLLGAPYLVWLLRTLGNSSQ